MAGIIGAILPIALQILGWFLDSAKVTAEAKERFYEWVKVVGRDLNSVKLMKYGDAQLKWLKDNPWKETT